MRATRWLKFLLIPGFRARELSRAEYVIDQTKSRRKFLRRLLNPLTMFGFALILVVITMAVFAPWLTPYTFDQLAVETSPNAWGAPSDAHPFGQAQFGWDVRGRMIWGARSSLTLGLSAISISLALGIVLGIVSAYFGGIIDSIIMRIMDVLMSFPGLILAIIFVYIWGATMDNIMLAYGILGIPSYARLIRGSTLQIKQNIYIEAARASGASNFKIMFKHILPNAISPVIVMLTFDVGGIILSLAGLSFLGFYDPKLIEWGNDISKGRNRLNIAPWASLIPGFMIFITVLGFMLVGDGLRDALDPRLKNLT